MQKMLWCNKAKLAKLEVLKPALSTPSSSAERGVTLNELLFNEIWKPSSHMIMGALLTKFLFHQIILMIGRVHLVITHLTMKFDHHMPENCIDYLHFLKQYFFSNQSLSHYLQPWQHQKKRLIIISPLLQKFDTLSRQTLSKTLQVNRLLHHLNSNKPKHQPCTMMATSQSSYSLFWNHKSIFKIQTWYNWKYYQGKVLYYFASLVQYSMMHVDLSTNLVTWIRIKSNIYPQRTSLLHPKYSRLSLL